jgi:hypothetical protein
VVVIVIVGGADELLHPIDAAAEAAKSVSAHVLVTLPNKPIRKESIVIAPPISVAVPIERRRTPWQPQR